VGSQAVRQFHPTRPGVVGSPHVALSFQLPFGIENRTPHGMMFAFLVVAEPQRRVERMLRITRFARSCAAPTVKLEGKLLAPWVDEVRQVFVATDGAPFPRLDLAGLTFVDAAGARLLHELVAHGVQIESCAPYVAELLRRAPDQNY
jgi:hypothetical protein